MVLHHPQIFWADEWLEHGRSDVRMVIDAERITDVVQQRADHIFFVLPIPMRQCGGLKAMREPIDRKTAAIIFEQLQMVEHPVRLCRGKRPKFSTNKFPVLRGALADM